MVKAKGMSGKRLSHLPPYGYIMGEDDKWVIDEETGPVVKEIFALCLSGLGPTKIANILTTRNIPTPGTVNYRRYGNKQGYCPQAPCKWLYQTVSNILERVEYLGHTVNFKTTKKSYKSKKVIINGDDKRLTRIRLIAYRLFVKANAGIQKSALWDCFPDYCSVQTAAPKCTIIAAPASRKAMSITPAPDIVSG